MRRRKRGRPPLPLSERKKSVLTLRLTTEERASIVRAARMRGMKTSEWVREALIDAAESEVFAGELPPPP